jgi:mono/diheme cytochrome c family protein
MRTGWMTIVGALAAVAAGAAEPDGRALYASHCAACHGAAARGDGPDADMFAPRPPSLRAGLLARHEDDALVERIRHGRPLALARDPERLRGRAVDTELLVAHLTRLPALEWSRIERGQELYVDRCEICHGPFGHAPMALPLGVETPPRDLSDPDYQRRTSDAELIERARRGHRAMPAITGLDDAESRDALVAWMRVLSPGYEHYTRFCAACHGDDGRGPAGDAAPGRRPRVVFDAAYVARADPEVLRRNVWHMLDDAAPQMPHFARSLRPAEVRAILRYLRGLPAD